MLALLAPAMTEERPVQGLLLLLIAGVVDSVLPRDTELQNPAVANVDQVLLVFSLAEPPWDGQVATRFLVSAEAAHIPVTVLLNEADLVSADAQQQVLDEVPHLSASLPVLGRLCTACGAALVS